MLLKNDGVLPLRARRADCGDRPARRRDARAARQLFLAAIGAAGVGGRGAAPRDAGAAKVTLVPFGQSITDGDRVPDRRAARARWPPGLLVRYYQPGAAGARVAVRAGDRPREHGGAAAIRTNPWSARTRGATSAHAGCRTAERQRPSPHRMDAASSCRPTAAPTASACRRQGGVLELDGRPSSSAGAEYRGPLPTFKTVELQKGHRYPLRIVSTARGFGNTDLVWKRVSAQPDADLAARGGAARTCWSRSSASPPISRPRRPASSSPASRAATRRARSAGRAAGAARSARKATGKPLIVMAMNGSPINLSWAKDNAAAIVEAWYPGQSGGPGGRRTC